MFSIEQTILQVNKDYFGGQMNKDQREARRQADINEEADYIESTATEMETVIDKVKSDLANIYVLNHDCPNCGHLLMQQLDADIVTHAESIVANREE